MKKFLGVALLLAFAVAPVFAQDAGEPIDLGPIAGGIGNLEPGFPAQIADTSVTPATAWEAGVALGYISADDTHDGGTYETAVVQVNYGILDNLQARAAWGWLVGEGRVAGNGDTTLGLLWAPIAEDGMMPSMGIEVAVGLPTGDGFTGYSGTATGVVTKTLGEARAHLNAAYTTIGDSTPGVRNDADYFAVGMDYPILDNLVLVADLYSREAKSEGGDRVEMVEAGVRTTLSDVDILSLGIAVGVGNGNSTPDIGLVLGYQRAM